MSTRHHWADVFIVRRPGPDRRKGSTTNSTPRARPGEGWAPSCCTLPLSQHEKNQQSHHTGSVAARVNKDRAFRRHQDGDVKHATNCASSKIHGRDNITIGTWNIKTLRAAEKLKELTHEIDWYRWNILGFCEMRWKNFGETTTVEGHKFFLSGKEDKHEHGVGFLVHKDLALRRTSGRRC